MSLTSFLENVEVRRRFAIEFPMPQHPLKRRIIAPPVTTNYGLVGTAFDYLLRFYIKRINPKAKTFPWVAYNVVDFVLVTNDILAIVERILENAENNYKEYLKNGIMNNGIIESCLLLAQVDKIYRASIIDPNLGIVDEGDINDMNNLFNLINIDNFIASKQCVLNPSFGEASSLVSGADMDILIDGILMDIKTTKYLELKRDIYNQLIGYYILSIIGGIEGIPYGRENINHLGIYYSRFGVFYKISIKEVLLNCKDINGFIKWFIDTACDEFPDERNIIYAELTGHINKEIKKITKIITLPTINDQLRLI